MKKKRHLVTEKELYDIGSKKEFVEENGIIPSFDEEEDIFVDKNGNRIKVGSKVIWYDPELSARDLERVWRVYDIGGDIVYIADNYGEAEVFPHELKVVE